MRVCQEPLGTFRGASAAMRRHRDGTRSPSQPDASCASRATEAAAKLAEALSGPTKAQQPQFFGTAHDDSMAMALAIC